MPESGADCAAEFGTAGEDERGVAAELASSEEPAGIVVQAAVRLMAIAAQACGPL